ncbi:Rieske (2Fe-2S) protein [Streptomyces litchfieldiae]|uniref:Rieske (2Fe-2S) protein n=1 Tax=Streptomyces litchfieldiae TaxID=3075543 RepID=A0ABU2MQW6_9ACTN|nr:Rieske (2Fe-2S) protein [Streptomyces sp. DSM 44938]MDT0343484.1 Rieske (2Fe-2S) protein [Streptomyces sp. DSM 44938]
MAFFPKAPAANAVLRTLLPDPEGPGRVASAVTGLERARWADTLIRPLRGAVRSLPSGARDVLHGTWLGHPLHPAMVQVPMGTWTSAAVLDLLPGRRRDAGALVAIGLAAAAPAAVAGWADWAELRKPQARVGLVHAAANSTAVVLYAASLAARLRGRRLAGRGLGYAGLAAVTVGGALGGHLTYRQAAGVNHGEHAAAVLDPGWHAVGELADFPVGRPVQRLLGDVPVLVYREPDDTVHVLADRCAHLAGPLSEGEVTDGCVRCPWHGSTFRLTDGWHVGGPATAPQPVFETRVTEGRITARLPAGDTDL